jgi:hypothetical protein
MIAMSAAKRFMIRPTGVASKKRIGEHRTLRRAVSCRERLAFAPATWPSALLANDSKIETPERPAYPSK